MTQTLDMLVLNQFFTVILEPFDSSEPSPAALLLLQHQTFLYFASTNRTTAIEMRVTLKESS